MQIIFILFILCFIRSPGDLYESSFGNMIVFKAFSLKNNWFSNSFRMTDGIWNRASVLFLEFFFSEVAIRPSVSVAISLF